jgi:hypothetical protein
VSETTLAEPLVVPKPEAPSIHASEAPLDVASDLRRAGVAVGLSALYGLALGARAGGGELVRHAVGVPIALLVLGAVLAPSLTVLLALLDAPVTPLTMLRAVSRAVASAGLVLAGLAPAAAVLVVTIESSEIATAAACGAGFIAGALGVVGLFSGVKSLVASASVKVVWKAEALLLGYSLFVMLLGARLFSLLLPMIGGAS